jgi:hypothetical protein
LLFIFTQVFFLEEVLLQTAFAIVRVFFELKTVACSVPVAHPIYLEEPFETFFTFIFVGFKRFAELLCIHLAIFVFCQEISRGTFFTLVGVLDILNASRRVLRETFFIIG